MVLKLLLNLFTVCVFVMGPTTGAVACGADSNCMVGARHYRVSLPQSYDATKPVGAIIFAHGYRGSAKGVMRNKGFRKMVSDMGLALIAVKSDGNGWTLPNGPGQRNQDGSAEFAYFDAVIKDATSRFSIDPDRIMVTGFSAGGMMVWNLACARSDSFAAFAPIAGTFWLRSPDNCDAPVTNIIHIHGDADKTVPLRGRPIGDTKQGDVFEAMAMYTKFGGFGEAANRTVAGLQCRDHNNPQGDMLSFCLFSGGHSFSPNFVKFAWENFAAAGKL